MSYRLSRLTKLRQRASLLLLGIFAVVGGVSTGQWVSERFLESDVPDWARDTIDDNLSTISALPQPERRRRLPIYRLDEHNSILMTGEDHPLDERWLDMAGNAYSRQFFTAFSYADPADGGPRVRLQVAPVGHTLKGRIEARGLKPNFAYQVKLNGIFEYRWAFESIGSVGRWRLPGKETNYTDLDYERTVRKHLAEAYIFFDFLITDADGNATRDFELTQSLHVLWNASRQRDDAQPEHIVPVWVDASDSETYVRPKRMTTLERIWAEREMVRYAGNARRIHLPPGSYRAEIALTEESFHDQGNDGGWWATVLRAPVTFEIVDPEH